MARNQPAYRGGAPLMKQAKEMHNFIESPICMGAERLKNPRHPTQKPLRILERIIKIASNPGDLVLDPFMGVGSSGVAVIKWDRNFMGFEVEQTYYKAVEKRLEAVKARLF